MPDLANRPQHEQAFAYGYSLALSRERNKLAAYGVERLPERPAVDWKRDQEEMAAALLLLLARPYYDAHYQLIGGNGLVRTSSAVSRDYEAWAGKYATETAGQIIDTTRDLALKAAENIAAAVRRGEPFPTGPQATAKFRDALSLAGVVDVNRISRAAVTEVTGAISAGERAAAEAIGSELGVKLEPVWVTSMDDHVCPICRPLNGTAIGNGSRQYPPAHVRCRCYVDWRVL